MKLLSEMDTPNSVDYVGICRLSYDVFVDTIHYRVQRPLRVRIFLNRADLLITFGSWVDRKPRARSSTSLVPARGEPDACTRAASSLCVCARPVPIPVPDSGRMRDSHLDD